MKLIVLKDTYPVGGIIRRPGTVVKVPNDFPAELIKRIIKDIPDAVLKAEYEKKIDDVLEPYKKSVEIIWNTPKDIVYGTPLSKEQLNATANVEGKFEYIPPDGTILEIGTHELVVVFYPADSKIYQTTKYAVKINVVKAGVKDGTAK